MFYVFRLIIDLVYVIAIYIGFCAGKAIGMQYLFTDMFIAELYCGFIGVAVVVALFTWLKSSIIFFIKAVGLYSVVTKTPPLDSFKHTQKQFNKVAEIAVVTKLITEAVKDIRDALTGEGIEKQLREYFPLVSNLPFAGAIKVLGRNYLESFTYLDECILAYSFAMDKPIISSLKSAITIFLKQSPKIMTELIKSKFSMAILNAMVVIAAIILALDKYRVTVSGVILFYIVIRTVIYVLDDALVEPFLMQQVIEEFIKDVPSEEEQLITNMTNLTADCEEGNFSDPDIEQEPNNNERQQGSEEAQKLDDITRLFELPTIKKIMSMKEERETNEQIDE